MLYDMNWLSTIFFFTQELDGTEALYTFFHIITQSGSELFYIIIIPPIYWCLDKKFGFRLIILTTLTAYLATVLKNIFGLSRPQPRTDVAVTQRYGFPSGHAYGSTTFWVYIMRYTRGLFFVIFGAVIIGLVAISRLYLGVHYPGDVIGGIMLGICTVAVFIYVDPWLTRSVSKLSVCQKILLAILVPLLLCLYSVLFFAVDPQGLKLAAALLGMVLGCVLESEYIKFKVNVRFNLKLLRIVLGLFISYLSYFGLGMVLPFNMLTCFITAFLGGFTVVFIAPWIFINLEKYINAKQIL